MIKHPYKIDISVLLIFFARPDKLELVFNQIKIARPSKLYLYQDGPRFNNSNDMKNIELCRKIVEGIDWDCNVKKMYKNENYGCDPSEYIAQKWVFENEEYAIILEDDDVPSLSFFSFCKELLEKYKNDDRIGIICGMNLLGNYKNNPYSYLFTKSGSIWGWATWKRNFNLWDKNLEFLEDRKILEQLKMHMSRSFYKSFINTCKRHKSSGQAHYESILASSIFLNSKLNVVPCYNMISNIGVGNETTHSVNTIKKLPRAIRRILFMKTYELEFPLIHPKYILEDIKYGKKVNKILAQGHPILKLLRKIEYLFNIITYKYLYKK